MSSADVSVSGSSDTETDTESKLVGPFPSEVKFIEETERNDGLENDEHNTAAPKVLRKYQIAYDRDIDGIRRKKDLFWNIMTLTYRQEYNHSVEARKAETMLRPGIRILGGIPPIAWGMFNPDIDDQSSDNIVAYSLDLSYLDVQDVSIISHLRHLRCLDLSGNRMKMDSMAVLENFTKLISLKLNDNRFSEINVPVRSIQELHLKNNRLMSIEPFDLPRLENIVLDYNRLKAIQHFNKDNTSELTHFSCVHCRIKSTLTDWSPSLTHLFLGYNKIRKIEGLDQLVNLRGLHLRKNRIKKLKGFSPIMKNLRYVNVRENKISNVKQFRKLRVLPRLKYLICQGNSFENEKTPQINRLAIVYCMRKLFRINKDVVTIEEIQKCSSARDEVDNEEDSSDDEVQEDLEDYDDEYNDAPPAIWEEEDDEFVKYEGQ